MAVLLDRDISGQGTDDLVGGNYVSLVRFHATALGGRVQKPLAWDDTFRLQVGLISLGDSSSSIGGVSRTYWRLHQYLDYPDVLWTPDLSDSAVSLTPPIDTKIRWALSPGTTGHLLVEGGQVILSQPYTLIEDRKAAAVQGGSFTSNTWHTRTLNTLSVNDNSQVSLSANRFTLTAGTWRIEASAPGWACNSHQIRLRNITDGSTPLIGTSARSFAGNTAMTRSYLRGRIVINASKTYELQHWSESTRATDGQGIAASLTFPTALDGEIYAQVELWKEG